ncbi:MAG: 4Fe-4S dicluster domain-containing protein [Planctomycetes bacterium]|nr:4Fe-4S dicluster domain-containing protein [Planctomycetota bacterium]
MESGRREFLKTAAGAAALGLGAGAASFVGAEALARSRAGQAAAGGGKRYALAVDTKKCAEREGCRACIDACHVTHNVPRIENREEEIKWVWKEEAEWVFQDRVHEYSGAELRRRPVLVLCNHCDNPPCVRVCPTQATFKSADGPVMMDPHRCIGCRYCVVGCPYGARSFNWKDPRPYIEHVDPAYPPRARGVVEKCTMCSERLAHGLLPACVEACAREGAGALLFGDMNDPESEIRKRVESSLSLRRKEHLGTRPQVYYTL